MKLQVVIHEAGEGGYWAEVPAIPGCATQGETIGELSQNLYDAVEGCLSVPLKKNQKSKGGPDSGDCDMKEQHCTFSPLHVT